MSEIDDAKRILMVDDDITSLDIVSFLFENRGYQVDRCPGGAEALKLLESSEYQLILIDIMMPGKNGIETVEEIRSKALSQSPIIAFTATDDPELHASASAAGCSKVLLKPIRTEKLVAEVEEYLR